MEEHYSDETTANEASVLKLVVKSLSQVVQSGAQNIEIAVMKRSTEPVRRLLMEKLFIYTIY